MDPSSLSTSIGRADILDKKKGLVQDTNFSPRRLLKLLFEMQSKKFHAGMIRWFIRVKVQKKNLFCGSHDCHKKWNFSTLALFFLPFYKYFKGLSSETRKKENERMLDLLCIMNEAKHVNVVAWKALTVTLILIPRKRARTLSRERSEN